MSDVFGTIHTDDEVEDAVRTTIQRWLPAYLREVERQVGLTAGHYQLPHHYVSRSDFEKWPEEMLPLVIVVCPGIEDDPVRDGGGAYRGRFNIGVVNVCSSVDQITTRRYTYRMGAAIRALLMQKQSLDGQLDGDARGTDWVGTRNTDISDEDGRTIWACRQLFTVEVDYLMEKRPGPITVPPDPTDPPATYVDIDTVDVDLESEPIA